MGRGNIIGTYEYEPDGLEGTQFLGDWSNPDAQVSQDS
jgi:hypothetical protein